MVAQRVRGEWLFLTMVLVMAPAAAADKLSVLQNQLALLADVSRVSSGHKTGKAESAIMGRSTNEKPWNDRSPEFKKFYQSIVEACRLLQGYSIAKPAHGMESALSTFSQQMSALFGKVSMDQPKFDTLRNHLGKTANPVTWPLYVALCSRDLVKYDANTLQGLLRKNLATYLEALDKNAKLTIDERMGEMIYLDGRTYFTMFYDHGTGCDMPHEPFIILLSRFSKLCHAIEGAGRVDLDKILYGERSDGKTLREVFDKFALHMLTVIGVLVDGKGQGSCWDKFAHDVLLYKGGLGQSYGFTYDEPGISPSLLLHMLIKDGRLKSVQSTDNARAVLNDVLDQFMQLKTRDQDKGPKLSELIGKITTIYDHFMKTYSPLVCADAQEEFDNALADINKLCLVIEEAQLADFDRPFDRPVLLGVRSGDVEELSRASVRGLSLPNFKDLSCTALVDMLSHLGFWRSSEQAQSICRNRLKQAVLASGGISSGRTSKILQSIVRSKSLKKVNNPGQALHIIVGIGTQFMKDKAEGYLI